MDPLFLNLQYWYCIIYSLFGGRCTFLEELRAQQVLTDGPLLVRIYNAITEFWSQIGGTVIGVLNFVWDTYSTTAYAVSAVLGLATVTTLVLLVLLRVHEWSAFGTLPPKTDTETAAHSRWEKLLQDALSNDPTLWRESILAADHLLGELLGELGVAGTTTTDKMRALADDAFQTVPQAWEAHRVRNFVSSGSSDYILTQREAYRVMKLYEQVFEEHGYI